MPRTYHGHFRCRFCEREFRYYYRRFGGIVRDPADVLLVHIKAAHPGERIRGMDYDDWMQEAFSSTVDIGGYAE